MTRKSKEMRLVYRDFLLEANEKYSNLAVLEADLSSSMATNTLANQFGKRYVNVGIMEAEMIGVAAGLAVKGYKPYIHTFGPFATRRVFDQVFISLAYAQLSATIVGSDSGISAEMNGGTHMPFEDLALMRLVPKATVFEVSDDIQFNAILNQTLTLDGLKYIRTIRKAPTPIYNGDEDFSKGYMELKKGADLTLIGSGMTVASIVEAANVLETKGYSVSVIDLFRVKPIHEDVAQLLQNKPVLTVENHNIIGGLGSAIAELVATQNNTPVYRLGVDERFGQVGQTEYLRKAYHLTTEDIVQKALEILA